jgi:hypothetical protein
MVKRTMNGKRLLLLGAFAAFASFAVPAAYANTLSNTGTITVKWNTQAIGSLVLHTNYDPTTGLNNPAGNVVLTNNNGGVGTCAAAGGGNVDGTVDFGAVSADITHVTNCQFVNAVNAIITTADPAGYQLGEFANAALPAGYNLCVLKNGTWANNQTLPGAGFAGPNAQPLSAACVGGTQTNFVVTNNATPGTILTFTGAPGPTAKTEIGMDMGLVIGASAAVGAQAPVLSYTLTLL